MSNHAPAEADDQYMAVQATPEFQALRKKFRGFVFPMTAFFLAWYFLYVLLSIFASDFMNKALFGKITIGLVFGLLQFVTTFAITMAYVSYANRRMDPLSKEIREDLEKQEVGA